MAVTRVTFMNVEVNFISAKGEPEGGCVQGKSRGNRLCAGKSFFRVLFLAVLPSASALFVPLFVQRRQIFQSYLHR